MREGETGNKSKRLRIVRPDSSDEKVHDKRPPAVEAYPDVLIGKVKWFAEMKALWVRGHPKWKTEFLRAHPHFPDQD